MDRERTTAKPKSKALSGDVKFCAAIPARPALGPLTLAPLSHFRHQAAVFAA